MQYIFSLTTSSFEATYVDIRVFEEVASVDWDLVASIPSYQTFITQQNK